MQRSNCFYRPPKVIFPGKPLYLHINVFLFDFYYIYNLLSYTLINKPEYIHILCMATQS